MNLLFDSVSTAYISLRQGICFEVNEHQDEDQLSKIDMNVFVRYAYSVINFIILISSGLHHVKLIDSVKRFSNALLLL
jgi:hypothetical protein